MESATRTVVDMRGTARVFRYFRAMARLVFLVGLQNLSSFTFVFGYLAFSAASSQNVGTTPNQEFGVTGLLALETAVALWLCRFVQRGSLPVYLGLTAVLLYPLARSLQPIALPPALVAVLFLFGAVLSWRLARDPDRAAFARTYRSVALPSPWAVLSRGLRAARVHPKTVVFAAASIALAFGSFLFLGGILPAVGAVFTLHNVGNTDSSTAIAFVLLVILGIVFAVVSLGMLQRSLRQMLVNAVLDRAEAQRRDTRPPILLLRSFQDDETPVRSTSWVRTLAFGFRRGLTLEQVIVSVVGHRGPVVAIGRPGEAQRPIGAARSYHAEDEWQGEIVKLLGYAQIVVVILGPTENIAWEFTKVRELDALEKVIIVFPPCDETDRRRRWNRFASVFGEFQTALPDGPFPPLACTFDYAERGDIKRPKEIRFAVGDRVDDDSYRMAIIEVASRAEPTRLTST